MKEMIVDITDDGEIQIETRGFKGNVCLKESEFLKNLLGKETQRQLVPAYYHNTNTIKKYIPLCG